MAAGSTRTRMIILAATGVLVLALVLVLRSPSVRSPSLSEGEGWLGPARYDPEKDAGGQPLFCWMSPGRPETVVDLPDAAPPGGDYFVIKRD